MENGYKRRNGWNSNKSEFVQQYFHSSVQFATDGVVVGLSTCPYAKLVKGISMRAHTVRMTELSWEFYLEWG